VRYVNVCKRHCLASTLSGARVRSGEYLNQAYADHVPGGETLLKLMSEVIGFKRKGTHRRRLETRFRKALLQSPDAIIVIDPARDRIVDANDSACRLLGYRRREIIECTLDKIHPIDLPLLHDFMGAVVTQGCGWTDELSCTSSDGTVIPAEIAASSARVDGDARVVAMVRSLSARKAREADLKDNARELEREVNRSVSELRAANARLEREVGQRRRAEQELRFLLSRHQLILDSAGEGILETDASGRVSFANADAVAMLGYSANDVLGADVARTFSQMRADTAVTKAISYPVDEALRGRPSLQHQEATLSRRHGSSVPVELTCKPVLDARSLTGVVVVFREITKRKQREKSLHEALAENQRLKQRAEAQNVYLLEELSDNYDFKEIIGRGPGISRVLGQVSMVAPTDASVLITGESGTGKELVARAIHDRSLRSARAFIKVNCAAIPRELFESEFFGHVRGAFTGATANRTGRFELADGGTLFLDEVGELPIDLQSKLLGVLQEGRFERVGDGRALSVNTRVIAATNRDLEAEVAQRRFRLDLFYRLNIFPVSVPPLRDRSEDIVPLAQYLLGVTCRRLGRAALCLSDLHREQFLSYDWPGNVREMQNVIERAVILARAHRALRFDIPSREACQEEGRCAAEIPQVMDEKQRCARDKSNIENALRRTRGRIAGPDGAARLLGIKPSTLRSRIKAYGVSLTPALLQAAQSEV
jgi:PAS domain S-box-containing protein